MPTILVCIRSDVPLRWFFLMLWYLNEYGQRITSMVCTDLLAAFNMDDLDIMMAVLEVSYGVKGNALNWYDSYLGGQNWELRLKILEGYFLQNRIIFDSVDKLLPVSNMAYSWISHVGNWQKLVHRVKNYSVLEKITF